jgi:hypothetical protein
MSGDGKIDVSPRPSGATPAGTLMGRMASEDMRLRDQILFVADRERGLVCPFFMEAEIDETAFGRSRIRNDHQMPGTRLEVNRTPVGFHHLSDVLAEFDPVADGQRALEQQNQPAEEVAYRVLMGTKPESSRMVAIEWRSKYG